MLSEEPICMSWLLDYNSCPPNISNVFGGSFAPWFSGLTEGNHTFSLSLDAPILGITKIFMGRSRVGSIAIMYAGLGGWCGGFMVRDLHVTLVMWNAVWICIGAKLQEAWAGLARTVSGRESTVSYQCYHKG